MEIDSKVLAYWQHCAYLHALMQITPEQIKNSWRAISRNECTAGKIADQATIESLLLRGKVMVVAPQVAKRNDHYFIPYYLLVEINAHGKFIVKEQYALPVIPNAVVETAELQPIVLGAADQFENYFAIETPVWQDEPEALTWQAQLDYVQEVMSAVTNDEWLQDLQQLGYEFLSEVIIFPLADLCPAQKFDISVLDNESTVELIACERRSGKSAYAQSIITDAWVEAAAKGAQPPEYVWLQYCAQPMYAKIFADQFLVSADDITDVHTQLKQKFNWYYKGKQLLNSWQNVANALQDQYADHGGPQARHKQLADAHDQAKAERRLQQVLFSIWERQVELLPLWNLPLDFIPALKRRRLQRLHKFFAQNYPNEDVQSLNQAQMQEILLQKIQRANNSERVMADMLHQVESDLQQEALLRGRVEQWEQQYNYSIETNKLWDEIVQLAKQYWVLYFNQHPELQTKFNAAPDNIELLIVEHAEYITPMTAATLLAKAQRAVIMGGYDPIVNPSFSVQIDYAVAKAFALVDYDSDFEDLQFEGVVGSVGNLWGLATGGIEVEKTFEKRENLGLEYIMLDTPGTSQRYVGSRVNFAEIDAIIHWLQQNHKTTLQIAIYTAFSGQRQCLQDALKSAGINNIKVHLLQEPNFNPVDLILFSPVYTSSDLGPYNFDRGSAMLENMLANAGRRIIIVGDTRIFKPQLHSAAGKFAKLFITKEVVGV